MVIKRFLIDADSCPVRQEIIRLGKEFSIPSLFIASFAHYSSSESSANEKVIYVDQSSQSVDIFLANLLQSGDVVFTNDYGLASMVLRPDVIVFSFRGQPYTSENIGSLLEQRHLSSRIRRGGGKTKGPKAFTQIDREKFVESVRKSLISLQENT